MVFFFFLILLSAAFGLDKQPTCECGMRNTHSSAVKTGWQEIYGGTDSHPGEWPFAVLIKIRLDSEPRPLRCGGTIITKRHVLTAAHCFDFLYRKLTVNISYDIKSANGANPTTYAEKIYSHEKFRDVIPYTRNDISVVLIAGEFPFGQRVGPACYGVNRVPDGTPVTALGWGYYGMKNKIPDALKMVELVTKDIVTCFHDSYHPADNAVCVDMIGKSVCLGDSGGPLLTYDNQIKRYILVGVTSTGESNNIYSCPTNSSRFMDLSRYKDWVTEKIKLDTDLDLCTH